MSLIPVPTPSIRWCKWGYTWVCGTEAALITRGPKGALWCLRCKHSDEPPVCAHISDVRVWEATRKS